MHENGWESMKFYKMDDVESNNQRSKKIKQVKIVKEVNKSKK